jgi:hypothetical protein
MKARFWVLGLGWWYFAGYVEPVSPGIFQLGFLVIMAADAVAETLLSALKPAEPPKAPWWRGATWRGVGRAMGRGALQSLLFGTSGAAAGDK